MRQLRACGGFLLAALAVTGCETASAPAVAPLRDTLRLSPEAVAALPLDARLDLRARFERAMETEHGAASALDDGAATPALVASADTPREARGDDVLLLSVAERESGDFTLHTPEALGGGDAGPAITLRHELSLDDALLPYADVIDDEARAPIERLVAETGRTHLVAAPGLLGAAVADADAIAVSPTWLALLGSLEATDTRTTHASLIYEPLEHHSTTSSHFGCYNSCDCSFWGGDCRCNYCGFDWGLCASECGAEGEGCHCRAGPRPRATGSFLDPIFLVLPLAYLLLRRRPR